MTLAELSQIRPDLANFHYAGCEVDGVYLDEESAGGPRWIAYVTHFNHETSVFREARCHPNCRRGIGDRYVWVEDDHVCCAGCITDPGHRYESVHE